MGNASFGSDRFRPPQVGVTDGDQIHVRAAQKPGHVSLTRPVASTNDTYAKRFPR